MTQVPLVYLPGSLCDERVFTEQLRAIDAPSQIADLTLDSSFDGMVERVLSEAPPEFALVALSMGCIVAAEIAHVAPERVLGMALLDFNLNAPDEAQNETRRRWASDVRSGHFPSVIEEIAPAMSFSPAVHVPLFLEMAMNVGPDGFLRQNDALLDRYDRRPIVTRFEGPLLIACGRHDPLCPPQLHADLAATTPHADLVIAQDAGHLSTIDQPNQMTIAIERWLQNVQQTKTQEGIQI